MEKSRTIAKAKAMVDTFGQVPSGNLSTETLHNNYAEMLKILKNLAEVAENYETLTSVQADLIKAYKKCLEKPTGWEFVEI